MLKERTGKVLKFECNWTIRNGYYKFNYTIVSYPYTIVSYPNLLSTLHTVDDTLQFDAMYFSLVLAQRFLWILNVNVPINISDQTEPVI